ncbi:MAG: hypothetical protein J1F28_08530 [Oscillospiraceae bacterium]|nr:hypothetical protein [Oscillospiraceae bacterium]
MRKIILAFILAAGAAMLVGCADDVKGPSGMENSSSDNSTVQSSSVEKTESSSAVFANDGESSADSHEGQGAESSSDNSGSDGTWAGENGIFLSDCPVPAWGLNESEDGNVFTVASEYDTYRLLQQTEFENGAVKNIWVEVYVISGDFDMEAFGDQWGFRPVWNGSFYNAVPDIPGEYAGMTVEEIKLDLAKPLLKKYGSATYDGFPEIVMVDPSIAPDPAFDF